MIAFLLASMMLVSRPYALPGTAVEALLEYHSCLLEPVVVQIQRGIPAEVPARQELVTSILGDCVAVRARAIAEADTRIASLAGFTDPEVRRTNILRFVTAWENGLRTMVVDHERWVEETRAFEACMDAGGPEC